MKAYTIVIKDNEISENCVKKLLQSSKSVDNEFEIERFDAITPKNVKEVMSEEGVVWNYPHTRKETCLKTGLIKSPYIGDLATRQSCFMSHYLLWKKCYESDESILILEHDAVFVKKLNMNLFEDYGYKVIGLNDPRGATRRSQKFYSEIARRGKGIQMCPIVDTKEIPQGLAGNSAYILFPKAASRLLFLTKDLGAWPNDALMCQQLMAGMIGVTKPFYTKVQGAMSTTTV